MNSGSHRILILSSDTGGGHRSAAAAIQAGVQQFVSDDSCAVRIVRAVEESDGIAARLVGVYNWLLRNRQHWMTYFYWAMNRIRPETRDFFYRRCSGYIRELLERWAPQVIVSVHPLMQHVVGRTLHELQLADRIPLVCVVTDPCYGFWKGWASSYVTRFLVASDDARRQLIDYGVAEERVTISGMPVHPKFTVPDEARARLERQALGLHPDRFTVFVNAGWQGGGNIPAIYSKLLRSGLDIQIIFLAGHNSELQATASALAAQSAVPVHVVGTCDHVEKLMAASHVIVSKLGGLTTFEALSCGLPIIADAITPPMPQEAGTAQLVARRGAGVLLQRAGDVVPIVRRLASDTSHHATMRAASLALAIPGAVQQIVQHITGFLPAPLPVRTEGPHPVAPPEGFDGGWTRPARSGLIKVGQRA